MNTNSNRFISRNCDDLLAEIAYWFDSIEWPCEILEDEAALNPSLQTSITSC
jgi:hypothetical protein